MGILETLNADPRIESIDDGRASGDSLFVNLARGWQWSGQRSFGAETLRKAASLMREVRPDLEAIRRELVTPPLADLEAAGVRVRESSLEDGMNPFYAVPGPLADRLGGLGLDVLAIALDRPQSVPGGAQYAHNGRTYTGESVVRMLDSYADREGAARLQRSLQENLEALGREVKRYAAARVPAVLIAEAVIHLEGLGLESLGLARRLEPMADAIALAEGRETVSARETEPATGSGPDVDSATGAAAWASYLVNGDDSGLEAGEKALADAWAARLAPWAVVDVERDESGEGLEARFSWSFGTITGSDAQGGELLDYVIHKARST